MVYNGFKSRTFWFPTQSIVLADPEKSSSSEHSSNYYQYISPKENISKTQVKLLTPKQMLQRLPKTLAQIQAGKTSKNLLNETCRIIYSLYQVKEITKKVCNNITNLLKL